MLGRGGRRAGRCYTLGPEPQDRRPQPAPHAIPFVSHRAAAPGAAPTEPARSQMNIFGVGTWEMLVIIVGALIIFGPGKLPEVMGQVGRAVRDFRRMTADLTGEFEKAVGDPN